MAKISASRTARLRAAAALVLLVGLVGGALLGVRIGTSSASATDGSTLVNYVVAPSGGGGRFNWFAFLLTAGPALVGACVLFAAGELNHALSRRSRSRSSGRGEDVPGVDELDLT